MKPKYSIPRATDAQIDYMGILFNDRGFTTRQQRLGFLISRNIDVSFLDEMTVRQAQAVITELKELKDHKKEEAESQ